MKIQSVHIKNFRTLKDVQIPFDSVTTFIGPNGTGKSTVLRALDWFFNGRAGELTEKDCSFGASDESIEVRVTFSDLSDRDRVELGKYAPAAALSFTAWKIRNPAGAESLSANARVMVHLTLFVQKTLLQIRKLPTTNYEIRMQFLACRRGLILMLLIK